MSHEVAAIIAYGSGDVYRVRGWNSTSNRTDTPYEKPGSLSRLGPDGWHHLEYFDSANGSGPGGRKLRGELIETATALIETVYEDDTDVDHIRKFPNFI